MKVTRRMREAAIKIALGEATAKSIAAEYNVDVSTVHRWLREDEVRQIMADTIKRSTATMVARAVNKLSEQLDSKAGNGFLAQNAANMILTRFGSAALGEDKQEITVRVEGMPVMGMPEASDDGDG